MTQDFGLSVDARGLIQQLKNNLIDRYPRDSILKELLQNADDARATWLELGWSTGLPDACHPLLRGPGLFAINDGPFKPEDAQAIRSFGLNHKATDRNAIGKFGLGLKSVFHLCEAFFFADSKGSKALQIVNPWSGTGYHSEWNKLEEDDLVRVVTHLGHLMRGDHWFLLWLPLRKTEHCRIDENPEGDDAEEIEVSSGELALHADHPGETDECPRDVYFNQTAFFADQLPMLRHVTRVRFWDQWNTSTSSSPYFDVQLAQDTPRCKFPNCGANKPEIPSTGRVAIEDGGEPSVLQYALRQNWISELESFRKQPGWPTSMSFASVRPRPDKALPHVAVSLSRWNSHYNDKGLAICRAVFLPLRGDEEKLYSGEAACYYLKLHGCFFVDAGRGKPVHQVNRVQDLVPSAEELIRVEWNNQLLRNGICPLILTVLEEFVIESKIDDAEIKALTHSFAKSIFFQEYAADITRSNQWLYCWSPMQPGWKRLTTADQFLEIPHFDVCHPALTNDVLPGLTQISDKTTLTPHGFPRLTLQDAVSWPDDLLALSLNSQMISFPKWSEQHWAYLKDFICGAIKGQPGHLTRVALASLVRRAFATTPLHVLRKYKNLIQKILSCIPPESRLVLPGLSSWLERERKDVLEYPVDLTILPDEFDPPDSPSTGQLNSEQAVELLQFLQPVCEARLTSLPAIAIVAATLNRAELWGNHLFSNLKLWVTGRLSSLKPDQAILSYSELTNALEQMRLFRGSSDSNELPRELKLLRVAVHEQTYYWLSPTTADVLFSASRIPSCSAPSIIDVLNFHPALSANDADRVGLLKYLLNEGSIVDDGVAWRHAVRYLLHAQQHDSDGTEKILVGDPRTGGVWGKIARTYLEYVNGGWRVLPHEPLVSQLNSEQRSKVGVFEIEPSGVADLVGVQAALQLQIEFTEEECDQLLLGWRNQPDLLKAMPIHDGVRGGRHRITENCFWQQRYLLNGALADRVTLLKLKEDKALAEIQKRLASELLPTHIINLAIDAGAADHWMEILNALEKAGTLSTDIRDRLADAHWLPAINGLKLAPRRMLLDRDESLNKEISQILATMPDIGWYGLGHLHEAVRQHAGFHALCRLSAINRETMLGSLSSAISQANPNFRIGMRLDTDEVINDWIQAFQDADFDIAPVWSILAKIWQLDRDACRERFLPGLMPSPESVDIDAERVKRILTYISNRHEKVSSHAKGALLRVHNQYLVVASMLPEWKTEILPKLRLLNSRGDWKPVTELCVGGGLDPGATLHPTQTALLRGRVESQHPRKMARSSFDTAEKFYQRIDAEWRVSTPEELHAYFEPWKLNDEYAAWAGALLSLLGDLEEIKLLVTEFLPQGHSSDAVRAAAQLVARERLDENGNRHTDSPEKMMAIQRVLVEVTELKPTILVVNLIGQSYSVCPASDGTDLFIGYGIRKVDIFLANDIQVHWLNLRQIDVTRIDPLVLRKWVVATGDRILRDVYGQRDKTISEALPGLTDRDHEIRAAQAVALNAEHTLRQLGRLNNTELHEVMLAFDRAADRKAEEQVAQEKGQEIGGTNAVDLERVARESLRRLIISSESVRGHLLNALRRKIAEYRYRPHAVLFELFQNADDAAVEADGNDDGVFAVQLENKALTVMHQGRPINRPGADGNREKAARDLRKMLALGHSDKGHDEDSPAVTGRFGLGFKSVYLLSDQPQLVSGQLGIEVLGGLYPRPLTKQAADELRAALKSAGLRDHGTSCHLPLRSDVQIEEIIAPYLQLAHFLALFARKIRRCLLIDTQGKHVDASWCESWRDQAGTIAIGTLQSFTSIENTAPSRAIALLAGDATLLLSLGDRGVVGTPDTVPTVWATAPTEELHKLGFVVNGSFVLDVGRSQVDWNSQENIEQFERLGRRFGLSLISLYDAGHGIKWQSLQHELRLPTTDCYSFWESVWMTLSINHSCPEPLHLLLWGYTQGCLAALYRERSALPSGIALDSHRVLIKPEEVIAVLTGELDNTDKSILQQVAQWPEFQKLPIGGVVSSRVWNQLQRLGKQWVPSVKSVDLHELVLRELESSNHFDPERATLMGNVVNSKRPELQEMLKTRALFLNRQGNWALPQDLLCINDQADNEEKMRAAFAPPDRILADGYCGQAVSFFLACRHAMVAPPDQLAEWAILASNEQQKNAVLKYLQKGEHRSRLQEELFHRGNKGWLEHLDRNQLAAAGYDERQRIVTLLATGVLTADGLNPELQPRREPPKPPIKEGLQKIAHWWQKESKTHIDLYDRFMIPNGMMVQRILAAKDDTSMEARLVWLRLFVSGIIATMGRTKPGQNVRFLELCDERGWFHLLLTQDEGSNGWLQSIQEYLSEASDHIEYFHWLRHTFLGTSITASYLDSFVAAFRSIDQLKGNWTLRDVLAPRSSHHFRGTGLDLPPIAPILGIGACVVIRELRRGGVIQSDKSNRYCYPPVNKVQELLESIGWERGDGYDSRPWELSRSIYDYLTMHLADPTFGGAFDLPLLALANDESLRRRILEG